MFSKLVKYEWKALFKQNAVIFLTLVLSSIVAALLFIFTGDVENFSNIFIVPVIFLYYILLIATPFATMIVFAVRFFSSTYGNEGYLTNTLPIKSHQIVLSKVLVGAIYSIIINLLVLLSMFTVISSWLAFGADVPFAEIQLVFSDLPTVKEITGISPTALIIYFVITYIISAFSGIMMVVGAVSFGQLWKKHKVLGSIVSYVGIYFVLQLLSSIFIFPITTKLTTDLMISNDPTSFFQDYVHLLLTYIPILSFVMLVALFFISNHILKKKINLD